MTNKNWNGGTYTIPEHGRTISVNWNTVTDSLIMVIVGTSERERNESDEYRKTVKENIEFVGQIIAIY